MRHSAYGLPSGSVRVLTEMMAMPPAQTVPGSAPSPAVSKVKKGLRVAGIGVILASILFLFGPVGPVIGGIILVIGSTLVFSGRSAWPAHQGSVAAGFGIIIVGYIIGVLAAVLNYSAFSGPLTSVTTLDVAAFRTALILTLVAGVITEIGVVVLPWRLASGRSKGLIAGGAGLSIVGLLVDTVLAWGVLAAITGGSVTTDQRNALLTAFLIGLSFVIVGGILEGVGYFRARGRLPAAAPATAM